MEIVETLEDMGQGIEKNFGKTGLLLAVGGLVAFGVYSYHNGTDTSTRDTTTANLSVSGYPTVQTNADVVISTLQDNIEGAKNEILENQKTTSDATNNYIQTGLKAQEEIKDKLGVIENVTSATYYEQQVEQMREFGWSANAPANATANLESMGVSSDKLSTGHSQTVGGWFSPKSSGEESEG